MRTLEAASQPNIVTHQATIPLQNTRGAMAASLRLVAAFLDAHTDKLGDLLRDP